MWCRATVSYAGGGFAGFQDQPEGRTVQRVIESALNKVFKARLRAPGSSRTDAGVSALGQVVSLRLPRPAGPVTEQWLHESCYRLNAVLPGDVKVRDIQLAPPGWNLHRPINKLYRYDLCYSPEPLATGLKGPAFWAYPYLARALQRQPSAAELAALDVARMQRAAGLFVGRHDFRAFTGDRYMRDTGRRKRPRRHAAPRANTGAEQEEEAEEEPLASVRTLTRAEVISLEPGLVR